MTKLDARGLILEYSEVAGMGKFQLLSAYRVPMAVLVERIPKGKLWALQFGKLYDKRSTGPLSQNHHLSGHIQQIAVATGNSYEDVKDAVKWRGVDMGYPLIHIGNQAIPKRERDTDTKECGLLIEACHIIAAEMGINLVET
jgi:hypothetical protein